MNRYLQWRVIYAVRGEIRGSVGAHGSVPNSSLQGDPEGETGCLRKKPGKEQGRENYVQEA